MKLNDKEKKVLVGVLADQKRLSELPMNPAGKNYGKELGAYRLRIQDAQDGYVPINLAGWIGRTPTESEFVTYHRTYKRLETSGLLERVNFYGGRRSSHIKLTPVGRTVARNLQAMSTQKEERDTVTSMTEKILNDNAKNLVKHRVDIESSPDLATMLGWAENREPVILYRDGEPVAVFMSAYHAGFSFNLLDRFDARKIPYTQENLDAWVDEMCSNMDMSDLFPAECEQ
ncbi:MAG: hypothetical protein JXA11_06735 [Phycisphaerae bacterium]|nr:hypothetical protein [Phycisphaerae bacterium]